MFLKLLEQVRRRYRLVISGYVVMPEHVHLLVSEPQRETLSTEVETNEAITGEFWLDGIKECDYLEPSRYAPFNPGHPSIEAGTYRVVLTMSPHLEYVCPEVLNVPGRTAIRWHIGNFPKDVLGCCVVGTAVCTDQVENSRAAFDALMAKLEGQKILAEYHDPISRAASPTTTERPSEVESAVREAPYA